MDKDKVKKMADLARIYVTEEEAESLSKEIGSILDYVSQIEKMQGGVMQLSDLRNVMREDGNGHTSAEFTDAILSNAPGTQKQLIKVKKILG